MLYGALALLPAVALTSGCADDESTLFIRQAQAHVAGNCGIDNAPTSLALLRGQLDLAVIVNDEDAALLESVPMMDEMLLLVSSPNDAPPPGDVTVRDLARMPLALPGEGHGVRSIVEEALRRDGLDLPRPAVVANSINIMLRSITEGRAHGVMPWGAVADLLESGGLVGRAISPSLTRRVHLSTCKDFHLTAAAHAVFDETLAQTRALVATGAWQAATLVEAPAHRS